MVLPGRTLIYSLPEETLLPACSTNPSQHSLALYFLFFILSVLSLGTFYLLYSLFSGMRQEKSAPSSNSSPQPETQEQITWRQHCNQLDKAKKKVLTQPQEAAFSVSAPSGLSSSIDDWCCTGGDWCCTLKGKPLIQSKINARSCWENPLEMEWEYKPLWENALQKGIKVRMFKSFIQFFDRPSYLSLFDEGGNPLLIAESSCDSTTLSKVLEALKTWGEYSSMEEAFGGADNGRLPLAVVQVLLTEHAMSPQTSSEQQELVFASMGAPSALTNQYFANNQDLKVAIYLQPKRSLEIIWKQPQQNLSDGKEFVYTIKQNITITPKEDTSCSVTMKRCTTSQPGGQKPS